MATSRRTRLRRGRREAGVLEDGEEPRRHLGLFSVVVIVAGATALHAVYTGTGPTYLGVSHYSQIESIAVAGQVLGPAFPGALGYLAPGSSRRASSRPLSRRSSPSR